MDKAIEWIKRSVGLCANAYAYTGDEIKKQLSSLEKEYKSFSIAETNRVRRILKSQFILCDLIYVLSFFIEYMDIKDFREDVLDCLIESEYDCYTASMLELQVIVKIPDYYEKKRAFHNKNVNKYRSTLGVDYKYLEKENRNAKRIVIVTEQLLNIEHAPTKAVLDFAVVLKRVGYDVQIFICPSDIKLPEELWYNSVHLNRLSEVINSDFKMKYRDLSLDMHQINMNEEGMDGYKRMMDYIYDYNPLFVYSMGMMNPVADVINSFTTVVARKYSLDLPVSQADILVQLCNSDSTDYRISEVCSKQKVFYEKKTITYFEASSDDVSRSSWRLPEDKFLICIVGNRLDEEIDSDFINTLEYIGMSNKQVAFVVIGNVKEAKDELEKSLIGNKVIYLDYCEDLMAVYKVLNLYINPKRYGGGYSALMALVSQIPVVTLPDCDVAFNAGKEFVVDSYKQMCDEVMRYINDKEFYEQKKKATLKFEKDYSFDNMISCVKEDLESIIELVKSD